MLSSAILIFGCLLALAIGINLFFGKKYQLSDLEIADLIERFLAGNVKAYEWDDFISIHIKDSRLEQVRKECDEIFYKFPATELGQYCNDRGKQELLAIDQRLKIRIIQS